MLEVKLISYNEFGVDTVEEAASMCYDSKPTKSHAITKSCIKNGHLSVTEHTTFTFEISGVSRACLAQITRHRIGVSFTVRSQRYCDEAGFSYVIPPSIQANKEAFHRYEKIMRGLQDSYADLQFLGIPNEDARMVLPNGCETKFVVTFNWRSLMHFFNERLCTRAQWEIRDVALKMRDLVIEVAPDTKPTLVPKCEKIQDFMFCTEDVDKCCGRHPHYSTLNITSK